jgi:hypothetical protein
LGLGLKVLTLVLAILLCTTTVASAHRLSGKPTSLRGKLELAKAQVQHDRAALSVLNRRGWTLIAPLDFALVSHRVWLQGDVRYVRQLEARLGALTPGPSWLVRAFLCIHRGEGSWTDSGDPYWGGLQMDRGFMWTYGAWAIRRYHGFADVWPPMVQIQVAIRAHHSGRGFFPWPNTARGCGLI